LNLSCFCKMSEAGADQVGQLQNYTVDQLAGPRPNALRL
jgi:hypothetical protein